MYAVAVELGCFLPVQSFSSGLWLLHADVCQSCVARGLLKELRPVPLTGKHRIASLGFLTEIRLLQEVPVMPC